MNFSRFWYKRWFASCLIFASHIANGQQIENIQVDLQEDSIIINYVLDGQAGDQEEYQVEVYSSHNDFSEPLKLVSGDVGRNISPGLNKQIIWQAREEIDDFQGKLSFRLRGLKTTPFVEFHLQPNTIFVVGRVHQIDWEGGNSNETLILSLYKGEKLISDVGELPNTGSYSWRPPKDLKPDRDYHFELSNLSEKSKSELFRIGKKIPWGVRLIPLVGVVLLGAILINNG